MKRKKLALVAVGLALGFGTAAGAAKSGLLGTLAIGGKAHPVASGITVHGKWSLVVRNKHGKVVARRRFENALTSSGATLLEGLTDGRAVVSGWVVQLDQPAPANPLACSTLPLPCQLLDSYWNGELHVTTNGSGLVLSGSKQLVTSATFNAVKTLLIECPNANAPYLISTAAYACSPGDGTSKYTTFTSKTITPVAVQGGQSISVSVQISFS